MGVLVSKKLFPIVIKYVELTLKNGQTGIFVIKTNEQEKKYAGRIKEMHTQWRQPNWKESNDLFKGSLQWDAYKGEREIDPITYRSMTLEENLKHWDVIDDDGKPVPCTKENMWKLDVNIAAALIDAFNAHTIPNEDELKN
jgi:hypothetical protein